MLSVLLTLVTSFAHAQAFQSRPTIVLTQDNMMTIRDEITDESVTKAQEKLTALLIKRGNQNYPIYIVLDSPGGSIAAGEDFIQFAKLARNVKTISIFAASMAAGIVEALPGERLIVENGTLMFHRAAGGFQGYFEVGEVEARLAYAKSIVLSMEEKNANRLRLNLDTYKTLVKNEMWLYGKNVLKMNAADKMVNIECDKSLAGKVESEEVEFMGMILGVEFAACPLSRGVKAKSNNQNKVIVQKYKERRKQLYLKSFQ